MHGTSCVEFCTLFWAPPGEEGRLSRHPLWIGIEQRVGWSNLDGSSRVHCKTRFLCDVIHHYSAAWSASQCKLGVPASGWLGTFLLAPFHFYLGLILISVQVFPLRYFGQHSFWPLSLPCEKSREESEWIWALLFSWKERLFRKFSFLLTHHSVTTWIIREEEWLVWYENRKTTMEQVTSLFSFWEEKSTSAENAVACFWCGTACRTVGVLWYWDRLNQG